MKTKLFFFLMLNIFLNSCQAQEEKKSNSIDLEKNKPQTKITVNKEYDEDGNLIHYDSTYSYYYSNIKGDSLLADSIFKNFQKSLFEQFPMSQSPFFESFFFEDSLWEYDFYKSDFFRERYRLNQQRMEDLFREMDSLKNSFFRNLELKK